MHPLLVIGQVSRGHGTLFLVLDALVLFDGLVGVASGVSLRTDASPDWALFPVIFVMLQDAAKARS